MRRKIFSLVLLLILLSPTFVHAAGLATVSFLGFITNPYIASIFVILGIVALFVEVMTPGFGLGALMSALFFFLFFFGSIATGTASILTLLIFIVGMVLLFFEVLVPGFGLPGISGLIAVAVSISIALGSLPHAVITLFIAFLISISLSYYLMQKGIESEWINTIVLKDIFFPNMTDDPNFHVKIGDIGIATSVLRPSGKCTFDGLEYSVLAEAGSYINKESVVEVVAISGRTIYVKEREND